MRLARMAFVLAGVVIFRVLPTAAQQDSGSTTTLQIYSRLTVVDVTATDTNGQPVQGLKRSDFTVLEDGKPQPIHNFQEIQASYSPALPAMPPNIYSNLQPHPTSAAVNILLLDLANEAPVDNTKDREVSASIAMQHYVKDAALRALEQMPPGTQVAILAMTNNLRILQSFTSNVNLLTAAINALPYDLDGNGDRDCTQSDQRNRMVLEALSQIAADTVSMKVRKNLIWFTVGVPAITDPNHRACLPNYSQPLSHAYDLLNDAQVAIYPIDARGLGKTGSQESTLLSMDMVAQATGGVAFYNTNNITPAVLEALADGANYYSMSYIPPNLKYDGSFHKIDVKVDKPGIHLVFRNGYFADDVAKLYGKPGLTMSMAPPPAPNGNMKGPMSRDMATSQQILFDVEVEPSPTPPKPGDPILGTLSPKLKNKRLTRYTFDYSVPSEQIAFASGPNSTHHGSIDFDIAVYDTNDTLLTGLSQIVKANLTDATYQKQVLGKQPIRFAQQIDLPPGQLFIRVGVLDHTTNKVGTLELPLNVGKKGNQPPAPQSGAGQ